MASLERDKLRLLNSAVQDNLDMLRGIRPKTLVRHSKTRRRWIWSPVLLAAVAFLWLPASVISTRPAATPQAFEAHITQVQAITRSAAPEIQAPAAEPQALDREVIPFAIKRIVIDAGHGGKQPGAISESGVSEKDITLDIARRLHRLLEKIALAVSRGIGNYVSNFNGSAEKGR
jgi:N-acetylmuramoyl-L-alanine amidase